MNKPLTATQALNNFKLLMELHPTKNSHKDYVEAVHEICEAVLEAGIEGAQSYRIEDDLTAKVMSRHETLEEAQAALDKLMNGPAAGNWTIWDAADQPCEGAGVSGKN